jgi:L-ascorbate metabolism protein UlaG (beta-lactamase superfamily)
MTVTATWLGHATFSIETPEGKHILVDPWVENNPMCPEPNKTFTAIDLMLVTHGHFDHIADAVPLAKAHKPQVVVIPELGTWLGRKGVENITIMNKGGSFEAAGVRITMVHADHSCGIQEEDGSIVYGGEAVGYVLTFSDGTVVYHAGDTNVFGDMALIHELYQPSVAMIPIGDLFTMSPKEAAKAVQLLQPRVVIPMHFGTFPALTGRPAELRERLGDMNVNIRDLTPEQSTQLSQSS